MDALMDGWISRWIDGWIDDEWIYGWMDIMDSVLGTWVRSTLGVLILGSFSSLLMPNKLLQNLVKKLTIYYFSWFCALTKLSWVVFLLHVLLAGSLMWLHSARSWAGLPWCSSPWFISQWCISSSRHSPNGLACAAEYPGHPFSMAAGFYERGFQEDQPPNANTYQ